MIIFIIIFWLVLHSLVAIVESFIIVGRQLSNSLVWVLSLKICQILVRVLVNAWVYRHMDLIHVHAFIHR